MAAVVVGWLAAPTAGFARTEQVRDAAQLFSSQARQDANDRLLELNDRYNMTVVIEATKAKAARKFRLPLIGPKQGKEAPPEDPVAALVKKRAGDLGGREIRVLICQKPADSPPPAYVVDILVGKELRHAFPAEARDRLRSELLAAVGAGKPAQADEGLRAAVEVLAGTLQDNLGTPFGWREALGIVLPLLAVWLFVECLARLVALRVPVAGTGVDAADHNGGGSFLPALFAAMAGGGIRQVWRRSAPAASDRSLLADTVLLRHATSDLNAMAPSEPPHADPTGSAPADNAAEPDLCDTRSYHGPQP
jgi:hypothetical protein